jgi:F-type H+-transporting ATPase subunit b
MEIQLTQIIFQIINFGVVLGALTYFVYKPVLKLLNDRREKVAAAAAAAGEVMQEKEELERLREKTLLKASQKAKQIEDEAKREAREQIGVLLDKSKAEMAASEAKFATELTKMKKEELKKMEASIKQAAVIVAEKVIGETVDAKKHQKLIDEQIEQVIKSL